MSEYVHDLLCCAGQYCGVWDFTTEANGAELTQVEGVTTNIIVLDACRISDNDNTFKGSPEQCGLSMKVLPYEDWGYTDGM